MGRRRCCGGVSQDVGEFGEALDRDGSHDGVLVLEVAVEDGLAVLDAFREPPGGDGIPALGLGELAGRGDDPVVALGSFALAAVGDGHEQHYSAARSPSGA